TQDRALASTVWRNRCRFCLTYSFLLKFLGTGLSRIAVDVLQCFPAKCLYGDRNGLQLAVRLIRELYMRPALFIAAVVLTVAPMGVGQKQSATGSHQTSVEEVIRKLDNERIQAQIHADPTALDRIYAYDFMGVGPSGTVRTKPQVISDFTSGDLKFQSITTDDVQVRVYGNTAVETGRSTMIGQDKGKTVPGAIGLTGCGESSQGIWGWLAIIIRPRLRANKQPHQMPNQSLEPTAGSLWCPRWI